MRLSSAEVAIRGAGESATVDIMATGATTTTTTPTKTTKTTTTTSPTIEETVALMHFSTEAAIRGAEVSAMVDITPTAAATTTTPPEEINF